MGQKSSQSAIAQRYTNAFYQLVQEQGSLESAGLGLAEICQTLKSNPELSRSLYNPVIPKQQRLNLCRNLCHQMHFADIVRKFFCLLAQKGRLDLLHLIEEQFRTLLAESLGQTKIEVTSAYRLGEEEKTQLKQQLESLTQKSVFIDNKIDKHIIAGLIIKVGSRMFDFSVQNRLKRMAYLMEGM